MFPPFPEDKALEECNKMLSELKTGSLQIKTIGKESEERGNHGIMIGALLCKDSDGRKFMLRTLSGISREFVYSHIENNCTYVPPIVSAKEIEGALAENDEMIHQMTEKIKALKPLRKQADGSYVDPGKEEKELIEKRNALCMNSQQKVFDLYSFHCADGKIRSLNEICKQNGSKLPPNGTGDCCAPKLLDYAFANNLTPVSMCEVFYGEDSASKVSGEKYPPCDERCALILPQMLTINILYRDDDIIVVNKQSGVLSVPGRGPEKADCIASRVRRLFPRCIAQPTVHRLDMETSGLLVLAFNKEAHRSLSMQFENREVQKEYTALLDGVLSQKGFKDKGQMTLYFRLDPENRPHQIWDTVYGKESITQWKVLGTENYIAPDKTIRKATRVLFTPHTGRTHQLRLASSDIHGFNIPIIGDTLYGTCQEGERLKLHSNYLSFTHPTTGKKMEFTCPSDF